MYRALVKHKIASKFAKWEYKDFAAETLEELDEKILAEWPDADENNIRCSSVTKDA